MLCPTRFTAKVLCCTLYCITHTIDSIMAPHFLQYYSLHRIINVGQLYHGLYPSSWSKKTDLQADWACETTGLCLLIRQQCDTFLERFNSWLLHFFTARKLSQCIISIFFLHLNSFLRWFTILRAMVSCYVFFL